MNLLKIKLYQELVNYRKAYSYNFIETFPLPSFSAIKGWIYASIEASDPNEYYEKTVGTLKIGVSGILEGITHDLQHMIKLSDMNKFEKIEKDLQTRTPTYVSLISGIDLNLYIAGSDELLEDFKNNIFNKYPSLGRYEDLTNIYSCEYQTLGEETFFPMEPHEISYYTYISRERALEYSIKGSHMRIPTTYEIINNIRYFKSADVLCVSDGCTIVEGSFLFDSNDGRVVDLIPLVGR